MTSADLVFAYKALGVIFVVVNHSLCIVQPLVQLLLPLNKGLPQSGHSLQLLLPVFGRRHTVLKTTKTSSL